MTLHTKISFIKSGIRIFGFAFLPVNLVIAAILLIVAETLGVVEELPGTYKGTDTDGD
jgi:hypothetical protein